MGPTRHSNSAAGSTYSPSSRNERWTASPEWARPALPTTSPRPAHSPAAAPISVRYDSVVFMPRPWSMLTEGVPATDPAKETVPSATALTGSPGSAAKSIPQ
jgi:hypothetical protein